MKRFFFVLLLLCCGLLSFAAEQSEQYCYIFNQDSKIKERDAPVIHSVKKNDWFLSDKLYNPEKDSYATIDGKTYKALGVPATQILRRLRAICAHTRIIKTITI